MSIERMAEKGRRKLDAKSTIMASNYEAAKARMVENYSVWFGPNITERYASGVRAAEYNAPNAEKWAKNWAEKMRQ